VIAFYVAHHNDQSISDILGAVGFTFFVFFAALLRGYLRRVERAEAAATVMLAGAALLTAGVAIIVGFDFALSDVPGRLAPAAAQALNVASNDIWFLIPIGATTFGISAGVAILRGGPLPKWLGWVAIVIGIATFTPALFFALFVLLVWVIVVSVLIYLRSGTATPAVVAATAQPLAPDW
jgi:hypothetical protein